MDKNKSLFHDFKNVAVIGAAGKMGSGISLLLLQEMTVCHLIQNIEKEEKSKNVHLFLIDSSYHRLDSLRQYLQTQLQRWAEKNILFLRDTFNNDPSLVSNRDMIEYFISEAFTIAYFGTSLEEAKNSELIFEAIVEDIESKVLVLSRLKKISSISPYFFSNTSSIPISTLNQKAALDDQIIGFHFYNPPAVQKLLEIIPLQNGDKQLQSLAEKIATQLKKEVIYSNDIAGFIGNGYFLREILFCCSLAEKLSQQFGLPQAIYMVNKASQEFLLRPMGIFQLMDYVGLDIVSKIGSIMHDYLQLDTKPLEILDPLIEHGKIGGQYADGTQKEGFFDYVSNKIMGLYFNDQKHYQPIEKTEWKKTCDEWLGNPPEGYTWKGLSQAKDKKEKIKTYFSLLEEQTHPGALMSLDILRHLQSIAQQLVSDGVAHSLNDVDTVLKEGFYHLYGPSEIKLKHTQKGLYAAL